MVKKIGLTVLLATSLIFGSAITASAASVIDSSPNDSYKAHSFQLGNGKWKEIDSNRFSNNLHTCLPLEDNQGEDKQDNETDKENENSNAQSEHGNKENNQQSDQNPEQETEQKPEQEPEQQNNNAQEQQQPDQNDESKQEQASGESEEQPAEDDQSSASDQLSQYEQEVVDLTNQEREKQGLSPLKVDSELSRVAREKSNDMAQKGYFSHNSPTYGSPFDMMKSYGINYQTAGENIARGQGTPQEVVTGWMNSEGHRANILNENFTHIGVGFVEQGNHWTQQFIGK